MMEDEFWTGLIERAARYQPVNRRSQFSRHFSRAHTTQDEQ